MRVCVSARVCYDFKLLHFWRPVHTSPSLARNTVRARRTVHRGSTLRTGTIHPSGTDITMATPLNGSNVPCTPYILWLSGSHTCHRCQAQPTLPNPNSTAIVQQRRTGQRYRCYKNTNIIIRKKMGIVRMFSVIPHGNRPLIVSSSLHRVAKYRVKFKMVDGETNKKRKKKGLLHYPLFIFNSFIDSNLLERHQIF